MDSGAGSYRRFLDGEQSAFDEIMELLFEKTVAFVNGYVHDEAMAEDITMDVFADLIVHPHRYNFKVTLKTYLFMMARSKALDCLKHRKILQFEELTDMHTEIFADFDTPESAVLTKEKRRAVQASFAKLPEMMRTAVYLVYYENMTYDEAAHIMKKSKKQVDNLLFRAKKELKNLLREDGRV